MTLRLIGAFQVVSEADHRVVHLKNKKARSLLAYLAMQSHLSAQRGTLANLLWPDCTDANARHSLRQCLVSLRKELEDVSPTLLRVESNFISLDPDLVEADAHRLLLTDGTTERPALGALLQSVRGDFLSDLQINDNFSDWASELRRRVHQKLEEILHAIDENPLTDDVTANAVAAARTLTQSEPFCEDCRRLLINLTARVHGRVRALAEYKCYAAFLRREGAGEPEAQTQELIKQIEQLPSRNAPMAQPLPQDNRDESLQSESSAVAGSSLERGSPSQTDRAALPAEDQPVSPIAQERSRPRGAIRRKPRFRWVEVASRMAAAAALILALPLFFQATGRFTHINQAEATALSTLMAEAHDDSILRTIPVAIRFQDLTGNNLLSEQLRETVSDAVSKILTVNLLADPDSASARYVLNGRIKTEPGSNVLLVDLSKSDGSLLWRERFSLSDGELGSQDIANRIGREIELVLVKAEAHRAIAQNDVSPRSLLLCARAIHTRGVSARSETDALRLYEKVLSIQNDSATALAGLSGQLIAFQVEKLRANPDLQRRAEDYLRRAIGIDPNQPLAHFQMGMLYKSRGQAQQALLSFNRALELNPSFAPAYANRGHTMLLLGRLDEALENVRYAMNISPNDGFYALWSLYAGEIEFERGNTDAAIGWFRSAIVRGPHVARAYGWIAGAYEAAGDPVASAENIRQFRTLLGNEPLDRLLERLRRAPEGGLHRTRPKLHRAIALAAQRHL